MNASPVESARYARNRPTRTGRPASRWGTAAYAALFIFLALIAVQCLRLGAAGLQVVDAKALLVVQSPPKTTVFPSGRMLISTKDPAEAEARARQLFALAGVG